MQNLGLGLSIQRPTSGLFATPFLYASFASNGPGLIVTYSMSTHWSEPPFPVACKSLISTYILLLLNISFFFFCTTLVVLKLKDGIPLNLPSGLRILQLRNVKYAKCDSFSTLLTACPLLQDFTLLLCYGAFFNIKGKFTIIVHIPTLKTLHLICNAKYSTYQLQINTPAL